MLLFELSPKLLQGLAFADEKHAAFRRLDLLQKKLWRFARKMQIERGRPYGGREAVLLLFSREKEDGGACGHGVLFASKRHVADALGDVENVIIPSAVRTVSTDILAEMLTAAVVEVDVLGGNGFGAFF